MTIPVISFATNAEVGSVPTPSYVEEYQKKSAKSIAKVHFTLRKSAFVKTASTKGISDISGTTKKPFKQKGTGNARSGSLRSPQYRGGGIIFGPQPISAKYKINKKEKTHAKKVLLSKLLSTGCIKVVDEISVPEFKTKEAKNSILNLGIDGSIAFIHHDEISYGSLKSFSNIPHVGVYSDYEFHLYALVKYDCLVFTKIAFEKFTQSLS